MFSSMTSDVRNNQYLCAVLVGPGRTTRRKDIKYYRDGDSVYAQRVEDKIDMIWVRDRIRIEHSARNAETNRAYQDVVY